MEDIYEEIIFSKNEPLFKEKIPVENHKIFYKYTSQKYYLYIYDLLDVLCKKSPYENNSSIFHISLYFILKILHKCENTPHLSNLDLIIFNCFSLGIKSITKQKYFPLINRIKKIYEEKYYNYKNEEIYKGEIMCLKLLNYNINILTAYENIIFLTQKDIKLRKLSLVQLEFIMKNNLKQFIYKSSFDVAKECIMYIKEKIIIKEPKILKKKIIKCDGIYSSPIFRKNSNNDKLSCSVNENQNKNNINQFNSNCNNNNDNEVSNLKTKKIININRKNFCLINSRRQYIMVNNINLKNSADKVYCKKNCKKINPSSSNSLISDSNFNNISNNNVITKKNSRELIINKLNKNFFSKSIYNNEENIKNKTKSTQISKKKIYLNINKIKNNRNIFDTNIDISMNTSKYFINSKNNFNKTNESKENDKNYNNISFPKNDLEPLKYNKFTSKEQNIRTSIYNTFMKGVKYDIETKNINLASLTKNNNNCQIYNISMRNNERYERFDKSINFNSSLGSHDGYFYNNQSLGNYYIY